MRMTSTISLYAGLKGPEHRGKLDFMWGQQGDMVVTCWREALLFGLCLTL